MASKPPRDPWFTLPVIVAMAMDASVTLAMQPDAYWHDHSKLLEGNPTWEFLLRQGPAVFVAAFAGYGAVVAALMIWLSGALQKLLGMFVLLAHTYGAASWAHLHQSDAWYWWILMGVLLFEAIVFSLYWRLSHAPDRATSV